MTETIDPMDSRPRGGAKFWLGVLTEIPPLRGRCPLNRGVGDVCILVQRAGRQVGRRYPAKIRLWRNARNETNAIESVNGRYRRAVPIRRHFPNEQSALKCLYLV